MYVFGDGLRAMEDLGRRRQRIFEALPLPRKREVALQMWRSEAELFCVPTVISCACAAAEGFGVTIPDVGQTPITWIGLAFAALGALKAFLGTEGARWTYSVRVPLSEWPKALLPYVTMLLVQAWGLWRGAIFSRCRWGIVLLGGALLVRFTFVDLKIPPEMDLWGKKKETKT